MPADIVDKVVAGILPLLEEEYDAAGLVRGARIRKWVVRNDDVSLFKSIGAALTAAAASNFFVGETTLSAAVGVAVALANIARDSSRSGVVVSELEILLLVHVKNAGRDGTDPNSLIVRCEGFGYASQEVRDAIGSLKAKARADGVVIALLQEDGRGHLHTNI